MPGRKSGVEERQAARRLAAAPDDLPAGHREDLDSARLVERFKAGDSDAFATLYSRYFDRVYAYVRLLFRNPHEAEDVTQQVFLKVFEALPRYQRRAPFWIWLFKVARNAALDQLEKQNRTEVEDPETVNRRRERAGAEDDARQALDWLSDADILLFIERLPLPQRQVLVLRHLMDMSNPQIAGILDRPAADIALLHHRAIAFLRKHLASIGRDSRDRGWSAWRQPVRQADVIRARRFSLDP